ncbi:hypothetical protein ANSO36C_30600 [Nostoc cf. commune SO-36]|uniref:Uncharacterized protein n=1 Tax=Nostoc cf. commune SO-36 TaxID=449208 RepID=A0ABN6Q1V1_NOSCO|nr:hypothetical protein [Nostoc commune]BDI17258.1 hypothetical protein ANSO36C_30600 [Nostoc cf. commune SO-36]
MADGLLAQAVKEVSRTAQIRNTDGRLQGSTGNHKLSFNSYPSADCSLNGIGDWVLGKKKQASWGESNLTSASLYHRKTLPTHGVFFVNVSVGEYDILKNE